VSGDGSDDGSDDAVPVVELTGTAMLGVVQAIPEVTRILGHPVTVVGGLAVISRLGGGHRATTDLDTVQQRTVGESSDLQVLLDAGVGAGDGSVGALITTPSGPVTVDVIEVQDTDLDPLPDEPGDRLYYLAHAWAATTATPVRIRIADLEVREQLDVGVRMAEPGPLVATKLQSVNDRPGAKAGTDLLDIIRLTLAPHTRPAVLEQCASCADRLAEAAFRYVEHWFGTRRADAVRRVRAVGGADVDAEIMDLVGELLADAFDR
jgi:hypothetical protein